MEDPTDQALAALRADWPLWEFWTVNRYVGGPVWCARRHDNHRKVINADSAAHLGEYLETEEEARR